MTNSLSRENSIFMAGAILSIAYRLQGMKEEEMLDGLTEVSKDLKRMVIFILENVDASHLIEQYNIQDIKERAGE